MPRDSKTLGAYFTPEAVAAELVRWVIRDPADLLLDPSSGDGRFVALHTNSVGVERDPVSVAEAASRAPHATIVEADFFTWASEDSRRFDCAAGNPPFIRYQRFTGATRRAALHYCRRLGVTFSGLSSSWAPFIVAAASKLRPGGRIAFVVPAEIGHAPYAVPLLDYLVGNFGSVHVVAIKEKVFPRLSEDCWLMFADNAGCRTDEIRLSKVERFEPGAVPPPASEQIPVDTWRARWRGRLRPFLLPQCIRDSYERMAADPGTVRLIHITGRPTDSDSSSQSARKSCARRGTPYRLRVDGRDRVAYTCLAPDGQETRREGGAPRARVKTMDLLATAAYPSCARLKRLPEASGFSACVEPLRTRTRSTVSIECTCPAMGRSTRTDSSRQPTAPAGAYCATRPAPAGPPILGDVALVAIFVPPTSCIRPFLLRPGPKGSQSSPTTLVSPAAHGQSTGTGLSSEVAVTGRQPIDL